jgi:hypothetical protein
VVECEFSALPELHRRSLVGDQGAPATQISIMRCGERVHAFEGKHPRHASFGSSLRRNGTPAELASRVIPSVSMAIGLLGGHQAVRAREFRTKFDIE